MLLSTNEQRNPRTCKYKSAFWSLQWDTVSILNFLFSFCAFFLALLTCLLYLLAKKLSATWEFTSTLMFTVLLSSLTLPLIYFFCDQNQLTYLLLWSKISVSYTSSPMQGKRWWERVCFCSWLYLMLCKSKFSLKLGAQLTESHERPCLQGFCAYEGVDVNVPSVG